MIPETMPSSARDHRAIEIDTGPVNRPRAHPPAAEYRSPGRANLARECLLCSACAPDAHSRTDHLSRRRIAPLPARRCLLPRVARLALISSRLRTSADSKSPRKSSAPDAPKLFRRGVSPSTISEAAIENGDILVTEDGGTSTRRAPPPRHRQPDHRRRHDRRCRSRATRLSWQNRWRSAHVRQGARRSQT